MSEGSPSVPTLRTQRNLALIAVLLLSSQAPSVFAETRDLVVLVTGPDGLPLEGARVALTTEDGSTPLRAISDAFGKATISEIKDLRRGLVHVAAAGFRYAQLEYAGRAEMKIALAAETGTFGGRVVDQNGQPVVGVIVHARWRDPRVPLHCMQRTRATTNANGAYLLTATPGDHPALHVQVESPGHICEPARLASWGEEIVVYSSRELAIRIDPAVDATISLYCPTSALASATHLEARAIESWCYPGARNRNAVAGRLDFAAAPRRGLMLAARAPGYAAIEQTIDAEATVVTLELARARTIDAIVVDESGLPLEGVLAIVGNVGPAELENRILELAGNSELVRPRQLSFAGAISDAQGRISLADVPACSCTLLLYHRRLGATRLELSVDDSPQILAMDGSGAGSIAGQVPLFAGSTAVEIQVTGAYPVKGLHVWSSAAPYRTQGRSGEAFEIKGVLPGEYQVSCVTPGVAGAASAFGGAGQTWIADVDVRAGARADIELRPLHH